jgi:cation transport protein ChaC
MRGDVKPIYVLAVFAHSVRDGPSCYCSSNPAFHYVERQTVLIRGWHRQFCLATPIGRGTPQHPGLVLELDRGGSCWGVAFRIARSEAEAELELVWRREMVTGAYVPR